MGLSQFPLNLNNKITEVITLRLFSLRALKRPQRMLGNKHAEELMKRCVEAVIRHS